MGDEITLTTVYKQAPALSLTGHPVGEARRIVVVADLSPEPVTEQLSMQPQWEFGEAYHGLVTAGGDGLWCELAANDGAIFALVRR